MADKTETEQVETTEQESTATKQDKTEKTFTQAELNDHVRNRLARAEEGYKKERETWETERTDLQKQVTDLQGTVEKSVFNLLIGRMSPMEQKMFSKMSFSEKLAFIQDTENVADLNTKIRTPETPKSATQTKTTQVPIGT